MLKLVIFDMDGLMLDTERLYLKTFQDACEAYRLPFSKEIYYQAVGCGNDYEKRLYAERLPCSDIDGFYGYLQQLQKDRLDSGAYEVKPGLFALLQAIEERGGIKTAVVTSNERGPAEKMLSEKGIFPHLNGGVYSDMVSECKPSPEGYLLCCKLFETAPQDALVLEDSGMGLRAAFAAGIPAIAVPDLVEPPAELLRRCAARCDTLYEVIPLLDAMFCGQVLNSGK